ncbi:MAG: uroporphyrinogen-III synthase, partial [Chloroflexota bacterium]
ASDRFQLIEPGWRHFKVAASGKATASILQSYGVQPDFIPSQFVGELLVAGLGDLTGQKVLLPRSKIGRPAIVKMLQDAGAEVTEIPLYDTVTNTPEPEQWSAFEAGFDIVTFTSPSSVRNFMRLVAKSRYNLFELTKKVFASIGPITSDALRDAGLPVHVEADPYTVDGIIDRLETYLSDLRKLEMGDE